MAKFKLIDVDVEKGHVSVSYSDEIVQTMCDCPLDSVENRDAFLAEYGDRYEEAIAKTNVIAANITDGEGEIINVD